MDIRLLRADEIECRIGTINEKGLSLLLYKDARADMKILERVHIKRASKIIANMITERKIESSLS